MEGRKEGRRKMKDRKEGGREGWKEVGGHLTCETQ